MRHRSRGNNRNGYRRGGRRRDRNGDNQQSFQGGRANNENSRDRERGNNQRPVMQSALPSPEIFQEYEYACEGTVARLLEMAETEQDRRNAWENEYLRFHKKSLRLGQLFGFILVLAVVLGTLFLASTGKEQVAIYLCVSGFGSVAAASLFNEIGRRLSRRPRDRR